MPHHSISYRRLGGFLLTGSAVSSPSSEALHTLPRQPARLLLLGCFYLPHPLPLRCQRPTLPPVSTSPHYTPHFWMKLSPCSLLVEASALLRRYLGINSAPACSRLLLEAYSGPIGHLDQEGRGWLLQRCFRLPYHEPGFVRCGKSYTVPLYGPCVSPGP